MPMTQRVTILLLSLTVMFQPMAYAMNSEETERFNTIMAMTLPELGEASAALLAAEYPAETWEGYGFPDYVHVDQETEMAYRVAVKHPALLGTAGVKDEAKVIPCYCTCDRFGHDNLLACFYRDGDPEKGYDEHGSQCAICVRQALLAYLWDDLGATHDEIMQGMKIKFAPVIEKYHQH